MARILVTNPVGTPRRKEMIRALEATGHDVTVVTTSEEILRSVEPGTLDLAFIDVAFLHQEAMDLITFLKGVNPHMELISLTPPTTLREAALTILRGASFYLVDPIEPDVIDQIVNQLVKNAGNKAENAVVVHQVQKRTLEGLFGSSPAMTRLFRTVLKVAPTDATILITGESGTGKELLAQVIHRLSKRSGGRFVAVNCAAIPENLLESELFGHMRGSFTNATGDKPGLIEEADGGTCFLDEVGELPLSLQVKLLRFLQDRSIRRVGSTTTKHIDVRVLAATNRNLAEEIQRGAFREDLFYRLNVINLHLLPLRDRKETLSSLIPHILGRLALRHERSVMSVAPDALRALAAYNYPGNIRELENLLEFAVIMTEGQQISRGDLPPHLSDPGILLIEEAIASSTTTSPNPLLSSELKTLEEMELFYVEAVLNQVNGNQSEAARILGISRTSLWRKLKKLDAMCAETPADDLVEESEESGMQIPDSTPFK